MPNLPVASGTLQSTGMGQELLTLLRNEPVDLVANRVGSVGTHQMLVRNATCVER
jgi:hypothetical protein